MFLEPVRVIGEIIRGLLYARKRGDDAEYLANHYCNILGAIIFI